MAVPTSWPWASFGSFKFKRTEQPVLGTDRGWVLAPSYGRSRPLGTTKDDIATLSIGSQTREYEAHFEVDRYNSLRALINTLGVFSDWQKPTPGQQAALLANVEPVNKDLSGRCTDSNGSHQRVRAKVTLISQ